MPRFSSRPIPSQAWPKRCAASCSIRASWPNGKPRSAPIPRCAPGGKSTSTSTRFPAARSTPGAAEFPAFKFGERARQENDCFPAEPWGIWTRGHNFRVAFDLPGEPAAPRRPAPPEPLLLFLRARGHFHPATIRVRINGLPGEAFSVPPRIDSIFRIRIPAEATQGRLSLFASQEPLCDLSQILSDDNRTIGIGLRYFMLCRETDVESRVKFMEYALLGDPDELYLPGRATAESAAAQKEDSDGHTVETAKTTGVGDSMAAVP